MNSVKISNFKSSDSERPSSQVAMERSGIAIRRSAYKVTGVTEPEVIIKILDGVDPLLYAAKKAIGPKQLTEEETRKTARRAFQNNPRLTSSEIGQVIGRSRQAVDSYIADLRAATQVELELKIFRMNRLGIPQDRIAERLGQTRDIIWGKCHHWHFPQIPIYRGDSPSRR